MPRYDLYSLGGTVSYSLDLFGGLKRAVEEQQALKDIQRDELTAAYVMLTGNVVTEIMNLAETHDELGAVNAIIAVDKDDLRLLGQAAHEGVLATDGPELLGAESLLADDENIYPPLLQQQDTAKHALTALLGKLPADKALPDFTLKDMTLPSAIPVSLPSKLAGQRPDIRAADARLHAASAAIGMATANLLPDITLSASYSYNALTLKDMFLPVGIVGSLGSQLAAPIFHGGTLRAEKQAAEAAYDVALAQYQSTVVQAFRQIADVLRAMKHDAALTESERKAVTTAEHYLDAARRNLNAGTGAYLEVIDATRQYRNAQLGYIRALAQRHQDTAQLFVALGGAWWRDPGFKAIADEKETP